MKFMTAAALLLSGCTTAAVLESAADPVPGERIFIARPPIEKPAKVIFLRDSGLYGVAISQHLYINGRKSAAFAPGEKFEIELPAGDYVFTVEPRTAGLSGSLTTLSERLEADGRYRYRILIDSGGASRLQKAVSSD